MEKAKGTKEKAKTKAATAIGGIGARAAKVDGNQAKGLEAVDATPARATEVKAVHTPWIPCGKSRTQIGAAGMP